MRMTYSEAVAAGYNKSYTVSYGVGVWDMLVKADSDLDDEVVVYCVDEGCTFTVSGWLAEWEFDGAVVVTNDI